VTFSAEEREALRQQGGIANRDVPRLLSALEAAEARVLALEDALREARPYVFNRANWRTQTAERVLGRVDAALAAQHGEGGT
jgi:hypothetical protein